MADISHNYGEGLELSASGGLSLVDGVALTQQRICKRLLTNLTDDLYNLDYGTGIRAFIGTTAGAATIQATVLKQMRLEQTVDQSVPPTVVVSQDPASSSVFVSIIYRDLATGQTYQISNLPVA